MNNKILFFLFVFNLNWFNLKVEGNERNDKAFEVLRKVVQRAKTIRILAILDVAERSNLRGRESDVVVPNHDLQLLAALGVRLGPVVVIAGENVALLDDTPQLADDGGRHIRHFSDDALRFVARVVEVPQLPVLFDFVLEEFVSKLSFVPNAINNERF